MNPIFPIIRGIEHALQPRGYIVLVGNTDSHDDVEVSAFESLLQRRVDGFILATGRLGEQQIIEEASAGNVPVVLVNRDTGVGKHPFVSGDKAGGIVSAITHLVELGHRHIVHVAGPPAMVTLPVSHVARGLTGRPRS